MTINKCIQDYLKEMSKNNPALRKTKSSIKAQEKDAKKWCENFLPVYENDLNLDKSIQNAYSAVKALAKSHNELSEEHNKLVGTINAAFEDLSSHS